MTRFMTLTLLATALTLTLTTSLPHDASARERNAAVPIPGHMAKAARLSKRSNVKRVRPNAKPNGKTNAAKVRPRPEANGTRDRAPVRATTPPPAPMAKPQPVMRILPKPKDGHTESGTRTGFNGETSTYNKNVTNNGDGTRTINNTITGPNGGTTEVNKTVTKTEDGHKSEGTVSGPDGKVVTREGETHHDNGTATHTETTTGPNGKSHTSERSVTVSP